MLSRTVTMVEPNGTPTTGRWEWNDETNTLEFSCFNPAGDKNDRNRKKAKAGVHFHDGGISKQNRGPTPNLNKGISLGFGQHNRLAGQKSPRQNKGQEHANVTLQDVKDVAIGRLTEGDTNIHPSFEGMFLSEQFDEFLIYLLNYFHWFYEKRAHEQKPNPMNIQPSMAELQYYADLCEKIELAQKSLGQSYCVLVLGVGVEGHHHMACGMSRVSSTYRDREMFETLYNFLSFVVWVTFRRPEYEVIKTELGRLLRSDTFNPAVRVKNAEKEVEGEFMRMTKGKTVKPLLSPAEYRRIHGKRPAIKSIINQRSPALVSILPSPKEQASWLFKKSAQNNKSDAIEDMDEIYINKETFKCGIIGEPLSLFNPNTLTPLGSENDEETETDAEKVKRESVQVSQGKASHSPNTSEFSRQTTGISPPAADKIQEDS